MKLSDRIARLENSGPGVLEITIEGGLPDAGPNDRAETDGMSWEREEGESVAAFKQRVRSTLPPGTKTLVWGGLPTCPR